LPFFCIDHNKFGELKQLSQEYKLKVMSAMEKEHGYSEEPKSGFIDFNRIFEDFQSSKLVHHHGGHGHSSKKHKSKH